MGREINGKIQLNKWLFLVLLTIVACAVPFTGVYAARSAPGVLVPKAGGKTTYGNSSVVIDATNASEGYLIVKYSGNNSKVKLQITGSNGIKYTYNLNKGREEAFPLTSGSGKYSVGVFENVTGNKYSVLSQADINASITNEFGPYLYPSQYVDFKPGCATVSKSNQLAAGCSDDLQVVENVYNYVVNSISYDFAKANSVQSGYISNVDAILSGGKGICLDYAAVMTSMLRAQGIPTRLEVGYAKTAYHAWISTYIKDVGWVNGIIKFNGNSWSRMDPTFASTSGTKGAQTFVGDGTSYSVKFIY